MTRSKAEVLVTSAWVIAMFTALVTALGFAPRARLFPVAVSSLALILGLIQLAADIRNLVRGTERDNSRVLDLEGAIDLLPREVHKRILQFGAWIIGYTVAIWLVGFIPASLVYLAAYLITMTKASALAVFLYVAAAISLMLLVFHYALRLPWPPGVISFPQEQLLDWLG